MTTDSSLTSTRTETIVAAPIDRAFEVFTIGIGSWWDKDKHILRAPLARMEFQPWVGGQIIDHGTNGTTCAWSRILAYEAPNRLVFSWDITTSWEIENDPAKTSDVEITFTAIDTDHTQVVLTHRHLDRHGDGWEGMRDAVSSGWNLDSYASILTTATSLPWIDDNSMRARLAGSAPYTMVILHPTDLLVRPNVNPIVWAHGRRNMALISAGLAPIITPVTVTDGPSGFALFATDLDEARSIMDTDPGVAAGIFTYEAYPVVGFPGATLP